MHSGVSGCGTKDSSRLDFDGALICIALLISMVSSFWSHFIGCISMVGSQPAQRIWTFRLWSNSRKGALFRSCPCQKFLSWALCSYDLQKSGLCLMRHWRREFLVFPVTAIELPKQNLEPSTTCEFVILMYHGSRSIRISFFQLYPFRNSPHHLFLKCLSEQKLLLCCDKEILAFPCPNVWRQRRKGTDATVHQISWHSLVCCSFWIPIAQTYQVAQNFIWRKGDQGRWHDRRMRFPLWIIPLSEHEPSVLGFTVQRQERTKSANNTVCWSEKWHRLWDNESHFDAQTFHFVDIFSFVHANIRCVSLTRMVPAEFCFTQQKSFTGLALKTFARRDHIFLGGRRFFLSLFECNASYFWVFFDDVLSGANRSENQQKWKQFVPSYPKNETPEIAWEEKTSTAVTAVRARVMNCIPGLRPLCVSRFLNTIAICCSLQCNMLCAL